MEHGRLAAVLTALRLLPQGIDVDAATCGGALLDEQGPRRGPPQRGPVLDAAASGAYRAQQDVPLVELLIGWWSS